MIAFRGPARERGRQHGEVLRQAIATRISNVIPASMRRDALGLEQLVAPWRSAIAQFCPLIFDELAGIADGSCRPVDEIILLNAFEAFDLADQVELGGCTAIGVVASSGTIVGQNWDANPSLGASVDIHLHSGPDTPTTVLVASPGGLGWIGMNEYGLALVNNDLLTSGAQQGLASQPARRRALRARSVDEATDLLTDSPAVGGRSYMLGDSAGKLVTIELSTESHPTILHHDRWAVRTNHAHSTGVRHVEDRNLLAQIYPSSRSRQRRAESLVERIDRRASDSIAAALSDHDGHPLSISRHESIDEPTVTAASVVFDCGARSARIVLGNPCADQSVTITL